MFKRYCPVCQRLPRWRRRESFFSQLKGGLRCAWHNYRIARPLLSFQCVHCASRIQPARLPRRACWTGFFVMNAAYLQLVILDLFFPDASRLHFSAVAWITCVVFAAGLAAMAWGIRRMNYEPVVAQQTEGLTIPERIGIGLVLFFFGLYVLVMLVGIFKKSVS